MNAALNVFKCHCMEHTELLAHRRIRKIGREQQRGPGAALRGQPDLVGGYHSQVVAQGILLEQGSNLEHLVRTLSVCCHLQGAQGRVFLPRGCEQPRGIARVLISCLGGCQAAPWNICAG